MFEMLFITNMVVQNFEFLSNKTQSVSVNKS
jgi:hypothetical protein